MTLCIPLIYIDAAKPPMSSKTPPPSKFIIECLLAYLA